MNMSKIHKENRTSHCVQRKWWNRQNFILPVLYGSHQHVWETIDFGIIGCTICGVLHSCFESSNIIPCRKETQQDSSCVCMYTGIVIRSTQMIDNMIKIEDYNNGTHYSGIPLEVKKSTCNYTIEDKMDILQRICRKVIRFLLYSKEAIQARTMETTRFEKKIITCMIASLNTRAIRLEPYNIATAAEEAFFFVKNYRKPHNDSDIPPEVHWDPLIKNIIMLLISLNIRKPYLIIPDGERIRNLIIAIVYTAINGIHKDSIIYLHAYPLLLEILPLELMLWSCMSIQSKIITEGENFIKKCINTKVSKKSNVKTYQFEKPQKCMFSANIIKCTCRAIY
jgi:hypothetical protein